jgi:TetR/AcrR family transcriptional repressor of nem operon
MSKKIAAKSDLTRHRILGAAATAFRELGVDRVGVRDVMKRAGLTRGGFYFHFADKDALLAEAIREAAQSNATAHVNWAEGAPEGRKLQVFIERYLSEEHRDHPELGCVVAALGGEIGRANERQRKAFTKGTDVTLERIAAYLPDGTPAERSARAALLMSSMAGVLMVSRALSDRARSDALLADARRFYSDSFGGA